MKVTYKMINKQLRLRGYLLNLLINLSTEEKYIQSMHRINKLMDKFRGTTVKGLEMSEERITRADGSKLRVCIYQSSHSKKDVPGVLWLHGGGYAQGIPELFTSTYKRLIEARNCVVVVPDYRLSIEAPYPAALEDAYTTLLWMKNNAMDLGIKSDQLIVGGESAGGGLTAAVSLLARDRKEVNIAFQMPLYPMLDDRMETESMKDNDAPIWNAKKNGWAWKLYLDDLYGREVSPYAAPARVTDYSHLPPTVTFVGDIDPFRDETMQYVQNLEKAGVPVVFEVFEGCYHGFDIIHPKAEKSKQAIAFYIEAFKQGVDTYFSEQNE